MKALSTIAGLTRRVATLTRRRIGATRFGGLASILTGSVAAQVIGLATMPVLSRLFSPVDFGYYTLVLALVGLIGPAATLRFEAAAMLPESTSQTRATVWNALISTTTFATAAGIILHALGTGGDAEPGNHKLLPAWVALLVLLTGIFSILSQLSLRKELYSLVARRTLLRSVATALPQLTLGALRHSGNGLLIGTAIGTTVGIASMAKQTREYLRFPGWQALRDAWSTYWRFPAVFAPSALLNAVGIQVPLLFVTARYGLSIGGQLGVAERIVSIPITVIGIAVGQVVEAEASKIIRERRSGLVPLYKRYSAILGSLGAVVVVAVGAGGGWMIPIALGPEWDEAGTIAQIIAISAGIRLVASPLSRLLLLLQRSRANITLDILRASLLTGGIAVTLTWDLDLVPTLWILYSSLGLTYLGTWLYGLHAVRDYDRQQSSQILG